MFCALRIAASFAEFFGEASANRLAEASRIVTCPSPKLDSFALSTTSLVFLPTKIFEIKIRS
jgi:hypothetical protein